MTPPNTTERGRKRFAASSVQPNILKTDDTGHRNTSEVLPFSTATETSASRLPELFNQSPFDMPKVEAILPTSHVSPSDKSPLIDGLLVQKSLQQEKQLLEQNVQQFQQEMQQLRKQLRLSLAQDEKVYSSDLIAIIENKIGKLDDRIVNVEDRIDKMDNRLNKVLDRISILHDLIVKLSNHSDNLSQKLLQVTLLPNVTQQTDSQSCWMQSIGVEELPDWSKSRNGKWDGLEWIEDKSATAYINEMLEQNFEIAQPRDEEPQTFVRKLCLKEKLYGSDEDQSLYIAIHTYGIFQHALQILNNGVKSRVVVVGPPGSGKSFGLRLSLLLLARMKKVVVLEDAKGKIGFLFVPNPSDAYVAYRLNGFCSRNANCGALEDENNFYLFDPSQPGSPSVLSCSARTLQVATPDRRHYEEHILKHDGIMLLIQPSSPLELIACYRLGLGRGRICKDIKNGEKLAENVIRERANKVGGFPRYVLSDEPTYKAHLLQIQRRVAETEENPFCDGRLHGHYMTVSEPSSILMHSKPENIPEIKNGEPQLVCQYHYTDSSHVWLHCLGILDQIWEHSFISVLRRVQRVNNREKAVTGLEFEDLVALMLTRPESKNTQSVVLWLVECNRMNQTEKIAIPEGLGRVSAHEFNWSGTLSKLMETKLFLHVRRKVSGVKIMRKAFKLAEDVLFANMNHVWDMALSRNVLIKCTVNRDNVLDASRLADIFEALDQELQIKHCDLYLIWIVPHINADPIVIKPSWNDDEQKSEAEKEYWDNIFKSRLVQFTFTVEPGNDVTQLRSNGLDPYC